MTVIHISDPETTVLVERLAQVLGSNKTATVNRAVRETLERLGQPTTVETKAHGSAKAELAARLRRDTVAYVRLRETVTGKKSGTRIYGMIKRHGAVETIRRLIMDGPSDGLRFLAEHDQLVLATEHLALDPAYANLFPADVRERAEANLAWARQITQHR